MLLKVAIFCLTINCKNEKIYIHKMESKYIDINENNFNSEYIKVVQIEETNKFNVEYNNKYMKIYSYNKLNSFGIKKSYNLYKISCIFNNERYKNIYIGIYEKIKKVFNKNPELNIKNPISKSDTRKKYKYFIIYI